MDRLSLTFASSKCLCPNDLLIRSAMMASKKQKTASDSGAKKQYAYTTKLIDRAGCPTRMNKDVVWHVLYDDDIELIRDITMPSALRIENESSGTSEIISYVELCKNLSAMQTLFFVALNADERLREDVCSSDFCATVWTSHGKPLPVCSYKATRLFQDMEESCIHPWMRNEQCTAAEMVDSIRMLYTIS